MTDLTSTITPKSDQLNADDLIPGPRTITITGVAKSASEQPVAVHFEGDDGKPWKPCKSMRRVMVLLWGANAAAFAGRRMTLYRDPEVKFGGQKVGGIRISHMSHIDGEKTFALTETRASRKPYTVRPLASGPVVPEDPDPSAPQNLRLAEDASDAEMKAWGEELRTLIKQAPSPGLKLTWAEFNQDELLRVAARSPRLARWIREPLPADEPVTNADGAAVGADEPTVAASPTQPATVGAASSATSEGAAP